MWQKIRKLRSIWWIWLGTAICLKISYVKDIITCEERDRIIQRIVADNDFPDYKLSILAGYQRSKEQVLERTARKDSIAAQYRKPDESYISITELVRAHSDAAPGYVIQSWMRSENTLAF